MFTFKGKQMYATYIPADPEIALVVQTPPLKVDLFGIVDGKGQIDNGLGFTQGSTAGIMRRNTRCSSFQRARLPEADCHTRAQFNLHRLCSSPYANFYDPLPCSNRK